MRGGWFGKLLLILGGVFVAFALLGVVEFVLQRTASDTLRMHDPFAGFANLVPAFELETLDDGTRVYRTAAGQHTETREQFLADKPKNGFRAFVIGGSSAAGTPYTYTYAFPSWLARRLEAENPALTIEVVNAAMSGYGSRRLLAVVEEITTYEPDLLIVYAGHNELAERRHYAHLLNRNPLLFRFEVALARTQLYQQVRHALGIDKHEEVPEIEYGVFDMDHMFTAIHDRLLSSESELFERDRDYAAIHYRHNLERILKIAKAAGTRVVLMTLSQNIVDWEPGASRHPPGFSSESEKRWDKSYLEGLRLTASDCEAAIEAWSTALELDPDYAALRWHIAQCQRRLERFEQARVNYELASDLDAVPHGAPTLYNDILREMADRFDTLLVDVERHFESIAEHGLVGNSLFLDFVHPNLRAHQLIAELLGAALAEAGVPDARGTADDVGFRMASVAGLYRADPNLVVQEKLVRAIACAIAGRIDCNSQAIEEVLALDPDNRQVRYARDLAFKMEKRRNELLRTRGRR